MNLPSRQQARKQQPRGFESLEPRHALDGSELQLATALPLPTNLTAVPTISAAPAISTSLPVLGMRVYTAPIGPLQVQVAPLATTATATSSTLPPITLSAMPQFGATALPIGPSRSVNLAAAQGLYAAGFLPTNQVPANLPTQIQRISDVNDPPGPPIFTLEPSFPLY